MMRKLFDRYSENAHVCRLLALALIFDGKYEEALLMAEEAVRLNKMSPSPLLDALFYNILGLSYHMMGQYDEEIAAFGKAINIWPEFLAAQFGLAAAYSLTGRMEEARAEAAEVLTINPEFSLEDIAKNGYCNYRKGDKKRFISALRMAGLK